MLFKNTLSKRLFIQLTIGFVSLCLLVLIYFQALSYFHKSILANQANSSKTVDLQDLNKPVVGAATSSSIVEKINEQFVSIYSFFFSLPVTEEIPLNSEKDSNILYLGSFPYAYTSVDDTKNDLRFDRATNAIMFPLKYEWSLATPELVAGNKNKFDGYQVNPFNGPFDDKRCLLNNCLEYKNNKLYYNGKALSFPSGVKVNKIYSVSLGTLSDRFVVGFTMKEEEYKTEVFYFNDYKFAKIPNLKTITSSHPGLLGFGGAPEDFLIVYGSYQGQAFRVRDDKITNIDRFVSFMNKDFKPEIIRAKNDKYINWYIYSSTIDKPQILKLWSDDSNEIIGVTSLLNDLKIKGQSAEFKILEAKAGEVSLLVHTKVDNHDSWQLLKDRGFKNDQLANLITLPIYHDAKKSEIFIKKIYNSQIDLDNQGKPLVKVDFSIDGLTWQEVKWGQNIDFKQAGTKSYFLKVLFSPVSNQFYSPYIGSLIFSYVCNI